MSTEVEVPTAILAFLEERMGSFSCGAHDVAHCKRVANFAKNIAQQEKYNLVLAYTAGLLHDVFDAKLALDKDEVPRAREQLRILLLQQSNFLEEKDVEKLFVIIDAIGFKNLIDPSFDSSGLPPEYLCVQDADLLDAVGAIGVARCFAFGGKRNRPTLHVSSSDGKVVEVEKYKENHKNNEGSSLDHFFEKLLNLEGYMSTKYGSELAARRQEFMIGFLKQMEIELLEAGELPGAIISKNIELMESNTKKRKLGTV